MNDNLYTLIHFYDWRIVALSILIAVFGSFVTLEIHRMAGEQGKRLKKNVWITAGAVAMGLSIWSMHYVGMAAFELRIPLSYDPVLTAVSFIPALLSAFIAFYVLHKKDWRFMTIIIAGGFMGLGITSMHYTGMEAIQFAGVREYNFGMFFLSFIIAVSASIAALLIFSFMKTNRRFSQKIGASLLLGAAISGMHYTGMEATSYCIPSSMTAQLLPAPESGIDWLWAGVSFAVFVMFSFVVFFIYNERRWSIQTKYRNPLTGLPNQRSLEDTLLKDRGSARFAVMIHIEHIPKLNETFGYQAGDAVIQEAAARIEQVTNRHLMLFHLENRKFLIFGTLAASLDKLLIELKAALDQSYTIFGDQVTNDFSLGITKPQSLKSKQQLMKEAERALQLARSEGLGQWLFYHPESHSDERERQLMEDCPWSFSQGQIHVYYQPKVPLASEGLVAAEALVRWEHPVYGWVSPGEFMPLIEKYGYITLLTRHVLYEACRKGKAWLDQGFDFEHISVNLSPLHFQLEGTSDMVQAALRDTGFPPEKLELEITESGTIEQLNGATRLLKVLTEQGIRISLDDFGTGFSSLTHLRSLPIHTVKLDRSFIFEVPGTIKDEKMVALIIQLAHSLGLHVVTEGVETETQASWLTEQNSDYGQGFLYSPAVPAEQFETLWLNNEDPLNSEERR
ncbi:bifunctional diguanylate cyclase/phosphodiesterase [Salsuginibacillus halophilus]|nr:EAL domain-containing protein [Salsuginibacillus halophilus]